MRLMLTACCVLSVLLTGCETPARFDWVKEGASKHDRDSASSECQYQIRLNKTAAPEQAELFKLCMQGKGYRLHRVA